MVVAFTLLIAIPSILLSRAIGTFNSDYRMFATPRSPLLPRPLWSPTVALTWSKIDDPGAFREQMFTSERFKNGKARR